MAIPVSEFSPTRSIQLSIQNTSLRLTIQSTINPRPYARVGVLICSTCIRPVFFHMKLREGGWDGVDPRIWEAIIDQRCTGCVIASENSFCSDLRTKSQLANGELTYWIKQIDSVNNSQGFFFYFSVFQSSCIDQIAKCGLMYFSYFKSYLFSDLD